MVVDIEKIKYAKWVERVYPMFCRNCGETEPKEGFYPQFSTMVSGKSIADITPDDFQASSVLCNSCDKQLREEAKTPMIEEAQIVQDKLEIKVLDTVKVVDSVEEVIAIIVEEIKQWYASDSQEPFTVTVTKTDGRAPPEIKINLGEALAAGGGLA